MTSVTDSVETLPWGTTSDGVPVHKYVVRSPTGMSVVLTDFGATVLEVNVPDSEAVPGPGSKTATTNVALSLPDVSDYEGRAKMVYLGSTVGRVANRIAFGTFELDGQHYQLSLNTPPHHLHGGNKGWSHRVWTAEPVAHAVESLVGVRFTLVSENGEEGYPGRVVATAEYTLSTLTAVLRMEFRASTDAPTILNMCNHVYWNLAGSTLKRTDVLDHVLTLPSSAAYLPCTEALLPTGEIRPVQGTVYDLRRGAELRAVVQQLKTLSGSAHGGLDNCFAVLHAAMDAEAAAGMAGAAFRDALVCAARVVHPRSGRAMEVWTTQPGVQVYTGNFLDGSLGFPQHGGLCLETQHFPDAVHHPAFAPIVLRPGQAYRHVTEHRFTF